MRPGNCYRQRIHRQLVIIMNATIIIPAIGAQYELEAERLLQTFPDALLITDKHPAFQRMHENDKVNGLLVKTDFARYLPAEIDGPVILCDADLHAMRPDPLAAFSVHESTDMALVPYPGRWFYPDADVQQAADHLGQRQLNSGFIYFKDPAIAALVSAAWRDKYLHRLQDDSKPLQRRLTEYDELALMLALVSLNLQIEFLDPVWNDWEHNVPGAIFRQTHTEDPDPLRLL